MTVIDPTTQKLIVGSFDLCRNCGEKLGQITAQEVSDEVVLQQFDVDGDQDI